MSTESTEKQSIVVQALGEAGKPYLTKCELVHTTGIAPGVLGEVIDELERQHIISCSYTSGALVTWLPDYFYESSSS